MKRQAYVHQLVFFARFFLTSARASSSVHLETLQFEKNSMLVIYNWLQPYTARPSTGSSSTSRTETLPSWCSRSAGWRRSASGSRATRRTRRRYGGGPVEESRWSTTTSSARSYTCRGRRKRREVATLTSRWEMLCLAFWMSLLNNFRPVTRLGVEICGNRDGVFRFFHVLALNVVFPPITQIAVIDFYVLHLLYILDIESDLVS